MWGGNSLGSSLRNGVKMPKGDWELVADYVAEHAYQHQEDHGTANMHRAVVLRLRNSGSVPLYQDNRISFEVVLAPHATWHTCIDVVVQIENNILPLGYSCRSFGSGDSHYDDLRASFLGESACFRYPTAKTLTPVIAEALEQAKEDLAALRLYDLDHGPRSWTLAAGLPIYISLFGRIPSRLHGKRRFLVPK